VDNQIEEDARLAQQIAARYEPPPGNVDEDERIARRLQEKYERRSRQRPEENTNTPTTHSAVDRTGDRCVQCQGPMPMVSLATNSPENSRRCNQCRTRHEEPPPYNVALMCSTPTGQPPMALGWNPQIQQVDQRNTSQLEVQQRQRVRVTFEGVNDTPQRPMERPRELSSSVLPPPSRLAIGAIEEPTVPLPEPKVVEPLPEPKVIQPETVNLPPPQYHPTNPFLQDLLQLNQKN